MLNSYMDAPNRLETRATSSHAPADDRDLKKQFEAVKTQMFSTNNGDKSIADGINGILGGVTGDGAKSPPEGLKGVISGLRGEAEPTPPSVPPDIKAQLADPNVEPQFNVPGKTVSMGTPGSFGLFPNGSPSPQDIDQHDVGDCFFDATLGSLAAQDPDFVKKMVHDNGDGTYTVHLFTPEGAPVDVTVNNQVPLASDGSLAGVGGPNNQANWASIIEKAFAKYNDVFHITGNVAHSGYAALNDGGSSNDFYEALTGATARSIANSSINTPERQATLAQSMQQAINDGKTVFTGGRQDQTLPSGACIVGSHQYSVVDVNQDANGNWYVDVRNPWGYTPGISDDPGDGIIRMSISDYVKYMDYTDIGDKPIVASGNNTLTSDPNKVPVAADMSITVTKAGDTSINLNHDGFIVPNPPRYTATVTVDGYNVSYSQKNSTSTDNSLTITDPSGNDITPPGMANGSDGSFKLPDGAVLNVSGGGTVFSVTDNLGITEQVTFKGAGDNSASYDITELATTPATS